MKKLLLTASLMLMGVGLVKAEMFKHPAANTMQPASIGYGGVKYATAAFFSGITTVPANGNDGFVIYGVFFSTGLCSAFDFLDVYDSTSIATVNQAVNAESSAAGVIRAARFYNVYGSSSLAGGANIVCGGQSVLPYPIRVKTRAFLKASNPAYNLINLLYWNQED